MTIQEADVKLGELLRATLEREAAIAIRDREIVNIQDRYAGKIATASATIAEREAELEAFLKEIPPAEGKVYQLPNGAIGTRAATTPALVPLSDTWTWDKIGRKLKRLFKARFFHAPKPPAVDKVKVKRELSAEQLEACGMKLETSETFFYELNRLKAAA